MHSRAFICGIIGPVGSGKTMAALQKGLLVAARQKGTIDDNGITWRKARIGVIRESYPSLKSTTLKSWFNVVPEAEGKFNWSAPFTHKFRKILRREHGRPVDVLDVEFEFRAIGDQTVEEACRGWEVNAVIIDEADLQPADLVPFLTGRVGRFSDLDPTLVVDPQIIISMNMPDVENHAYQLLFEKAMEGMAPDDLAMLDEVLQGRPLIDRFVQPGGMEPDAENIHNLPNGRGYYLLQVATNRHKPGYVDRMVHNKPVPLMHGLPVNPGFVYTRHVRPTEWIKGRQVVVGIDGGYTAAAVFLQRTAAGGIRIHGEVVNRSKDGKSVLGWSAETFGKMIRQRLLERFPGIQPEQIRFVCDPAAFKGKDSPRDAIDWVRSVKNAIGMGPIHKAKSNSPALRNEAIWKAHGSIDSYRDGDYYVDPSCTHLIKGHSGGYRYEKSTLGTGEEKGDVPIANTIFTHVCDSEQYAALEGEHVVAQIRGEQPRTAPVKILSDFDELGG
ncbi:hypothetical protein [Sphingobium sp. LSP13-1-1.1]|uniref:hypothetical protein n=1 Tax=Sphingobium sp. LSP13-1-1.1 TaxID=3135234 RepID=UPI003434DC24